MDGYLDYLFFGTIIACAGGNIAHFGSRRLLLVPAGRLLWGIAAILLLMTPIVLLFRAWTWEVIAASLVGAIIGAVLGRFLRHARSEFMLSLVLAVAGSVLLVRALFLGVPA